MIRTDPVLRPEYAAVDFNMTELSRWWWLWAQGNAGRCCSAVYELCSFDCLKRVVLNRFGARFRIDLATQRIPVHTTANRFPWLFLEFVSRHRRLGRPCVREAIAVNAYRILCL